MMSGDIGKTARALRLAVWIFWGCIVVAYAVGRLGLETDFLRVRTHVDGTSSDTMTIVADVTMVLLSIALYHLSRMLGAIAGGDLFSAQVVGAFRAFAFWLLVVTIVWILAPIGASLLAGPDDAQHIELRFQLRDALTGGLALILFLVARLLERARAIDEEMREIV
jgi:hypothetical protein